MSHLRCLSAVVVAILTMATVAPASAAPHIDINPRPVPGWSPVIDISLPPQSVGNLGCSNGIVFGNFTDLDQDDDTLRVYAIAENDGWPLIYYPTVRVWGTFMAVVPGHGGMINLVAFDADGNKASHYPTRMRQDGSCR